MTEETIPEATRIARREPAALRPAEAASNIEDLLRAAIDKGTPVESMEKLVTLYERLDDRRRAAEFYAALAEFQKSCPSIPRTSESKPSTNRPGTSFTFKYAALDTIAATVGPHLHKLGLSYTWDSVVSQNQVECVCILRHLNGHSISAKFSCPVDASAHMNPMQKVASARGYACRYALIQVLGLTTAEPDTDVASSERITEEQVATLTSLIEEARVVTATFLKYMKAERLQDILQADYAKAVTALEAKRKAAR